MVKKIVASALSLIMVLCMAFATASVAYASEQPYSNAESSQQSSEPAASTSETSDSNNTKGTDPDDTFAQTSGMDEVNLLTPNPEILLIEGAQSSLLAESAALSTSTASTDFPTQELNSLSLIDTIKAIIELNNALEELYKTLRNASGPSVARADSGYITETDLTAAFHEGVYYMKVLNLVNKINELTRKLGYSSDLSVSSLPIVVVGELPSGFVFENNTLTLKDSTLLSWNEERGDDPEALSRSYEITLRLSIGSRYIEAFLISKGIYGFAAETFSIELLLTNLPGNGGDPEEEEPPVDPEDPIPPTPDPPIDETPDTSTPVTNDTGAVAASIVTAPASESTTDTEEEAAKPEETQIRESDTSSNIGSDQMIDAPQIPTASMMVNNNGNTVATNVALVSLSAVFSATSLFSLRRLKPGGLMAATATAQVGSLTPILGYMGIGLGVLSASLLLLSQYLVDPALNTSISWTPVLITIGVVQFACTLIMLASVRITKKRAGAKRFKIRY